MPTMNGVLCSVHLEPEMDNFLHAQAFALNVSKNDLLRRYLLAGAKVELDLALNAPSSSKKHQSIPTSVLRAARAAKIIPMGSGGPDARPVASSHRVQAQKAAQKTVAPKTSASKKSTSKKVVKKSVQKNAK